MSTTIRTRFAPSPTGFLHVGGIRTALFAYLVARSNNGKFVLRLEDTDQKREVPGSREHLIASLKALGLIYDEGPDVGGEYGPYVQSERLYIYKRWAQKLIDSGRAYADPYSPEEIQAFRDAAQAEKRAFLYRDHRPENPPTWDGTTPLRFKSEPKAYDWHDEVMGDLHTGPEVIDDIILIKSDGYPTYNFAHIVDDAEMKISHIIRGQEFISSMPNYLNLYEALGLERPLFAHMPHILNEQGNKKLGKRDGAKDVLDYIRDGYLPETMVSFIATLGWNDGTEQEIFTMNELVEKFSLSRVQKSGARFDEKRLLWMNGNFIRELSLDELTDRIEYFWSESAKKHPEPYKKQVLGLVQDRLKTLKDLPLLTSYFFEEPARNLELIESNKQLAKLTAEEQASLIRQAKQALEALEDWSGDGIQTALNTLLETTGQKPGVLFSLIRIVTTWAPFSPQLNDTLALIGKERTVSRLEQFLK
jgi:glutamyl-tRNA synthetase